MTSIFITSIINASCYNHYIFGNNYGKTYLNKAMNT